MNDPLKWWEERSVLLQAFVYTIMMISGLFLAVLGGKFAGFAVILLYGAGWLSRHTQNPKANNFLDPERHPVQDYHQ